MYAEKYSSLDSAELNFELLKLFKNEYKSMVVKNLIISQASNVEIKSPKLLKLETSANTLKQSQGMFSAIYEDNIKKEHRVYFKYKLIAELEVCRAAKDIPRSARLNLDDVVSSYISFEKSAFKNLSKEEIVGLSTKRFIKEGNIITLLDVGKVPIVVRNSNIVALVTEGELEIEFEAMSIEDGIMGQIITIKSKNGKSYKAEVVGESRVKIK